MRARSLDCCYVDISYAMDGTCGKTRPRPDDRTTYWLIHPVGCCDMPRAAVQCRERMWHGLAEVGIAHLETTLEHHSTLGEAQIAAAGYGAEW